MQTGVVKDEDGNEFPGVLRPNGSVTWKAGNVQRYADLSAFEDIGLTWTATPDDVEMPSVTQLVFGRVAGSES
jgi:hypothetical protein